MAKFREERSQRKNTIRPVNTRKKLIRILIVCEGMKTEPNYFKSFPVRGDVEIMIEGGAGNTISLVERARDLAVSGNYRLSSSEDSQDDEPIDQVWCVFDRDSFPSGNFNTAIQMAKSHGLSCAYTNQAFELWYLLHFDFHTTAYHRDRYSSMLSTKLGRRYNKNDSDTYQHILPHQSNAIRNAERLMREYGDLHNPENDNPCTTVHELVKSLNKLLR